MHPLFAVATETAWESIARNTAAGLIVFFATTLLGVVARYGKRIWNGFKSLLANLEAADGRFAKALEDAVAKFDLNKAATDQYQADTTKAIGAHESRIAKMERAQAKQSKEVNAAIKEARGAATQATIAATEATTAANRAAASVERVEAKIDGLPSTAERIEAKIDHLPQAVGK